MASAPIPATSWPPHATLDNHRPRAHDERGNPYLLDRVIVGRTPDGNLVALSVTLGWRDDATRASTEHKSLPGYTALVITAECWHARSAEHPTAHHGVADTPDILRAVADHGPVTRATGDALTTIAALCERWNLNDLQPGCSHQGAPEADWGAPDAMANVPVCAVSGHEWGSAWLVQEIPDDVVAHLYRLAETVHREWQHLAVDAELEALMAANAQEVHRGV